jgi:hypothetical protein
VTAWVLCTGLAAFEGEFSAIEHLTTYTQYLADSSPTQSLSIGAGLIFGDWEKFIDDKASSLQILLSELSAITQDTDLDGAEVPSPLAVETTKRLLDRSFSLNLLPERVLASAEGGVFLAYARGVQIANLEIFNNGLVFAASHRDGSQRLAGIDSRRSRGRRNSRTNP